MHSECKYWAIWSYRWSLFCSLLSLSWESENQNRLCESLMATQITLPVCHQFFLSSKISFYNHSPNFLKARIFLSKIAGIWVSFNVNPLKRFGLWPCLPHKFRLSLIQQIQLYRDQNRQKRRGVKRIYSRTFPTLLYFSVRCDNTWGIKEIYTWWSHPSLRLWIHADRPDWDHGLWHWLSQEVAFWDLWVWCES